MRKMGKLENLKFHVVRHEAFNISRRKSAPESGQHPGPSFAFEKVTTQVKCKQGEL